MIVAEVVINKEIAMAQMTCSRCGNYGIYWRNLGGTNQHTYCPSCKGINCQFQEEDEIDSDEHEDAGDR